MESGQCASCHRQRPLWRYQPQHAMHFYFPDSLVCRWCTRDVQPLLCAGCYQAEYDREMAEPVGAAEQAAINLIAGRSPARREYERDAPATASESELAPVPPVRGQLALDEVIRRG